MRDLQGKTVLLTGASTGLGPHIARRLRRGGAKLVLSARNREALGRLAAEFGGEHMVAADLSLPGEPEKLAAAAGGVDVLVSNAGIPATGRLATFSIVRGQDPGRRRDHVQRETRNRRRPDPAMCRAR